ncbi:hypothetical protein [Streptomyces canus]|uniref:hypothetical protein n=1 Tax=Streptomyces canus TaxID=58343 RepID=UPI003250F7CB
MSLTIPFVGRRDRKHSPDTVIRNLRRDMAKVMNRQAAADDFFAILMHDVVTTNAAWEQEKQLRGAAEEAAKRMQSDRDEWMAEAERLAAELAPYKAAEANAAAVDVPPMKRIGCDDSTTSVDVTTLWEAAEAGLLPGCGPGRLT